MSWQELLVASFSRAIGRGKAAICSASHQLPPFPPLPASAPWPAEWGYPRALCFVHRQQPVVWCLGVLALPPRGMAGKECLCRAATWGCCYALQENSPGSKVLCLSLQLQIGEQPENQASSTSVREGPDPSSAELPACFLPGAHPALLRGQWLGVELPKAGLCRRPCSACTVPQEGGGQ